MLLKKVRSMALPQLKVIGVVLLLTAGGVAAAAGTVTLLGRQTDGTIVVPTNQILHPAGTTFLLGQRPVDIALRPDGKQ